MPVTALHGRDRDALAARSTDEVTVTEIEPGMRDAFGIGLEIDKIPWLQCIDRYLAACTILFIRSAGKNDALPVEYVLDEAGAVEASRCRAAKLVRYADIFLCFFLGSLFCFGAEIFLR